MSELSREFRQAARSLRRSPGFAASVVAMLALGIGANAAIYSVVRSVILRPVPYPAPERLVFVRSNHRPSDLGEEISPGNFVDLRRGNPSFEQLGAFGPLTVDSSVDGTPERLQAAQITPGGLAALGVKPLYGRLFLPDEERPDSRVAVLLYGLWKTRFGGDPSVVGRTIRLSGLSYPIVGVLPAEFRFPGRRAGDVQLLVPLRLTPERVADRGSRWLYIVGRLKRGSSLETAQRELDVRTAALARSFPLDDEGWGVRVMPLREAIVGRARPALLVLLATSLLALAAACANIANLILARASSRRGEMTLRAALGAGSKDLLRPYLIEGLVLSLSGAALGALLARGGLRFLVAAMPREVPRLAEVRLDSGVLAFALVLAVLVAIAFGLAPALLAWRSDPARALRAEGRETGGARSTRTRRLVTVAEVATALVLLVGASLLLTSLARLLRVEPGFVPRDVLTAEVVLPSSRYPDDGRRSAFFRALAARAAVLPGVESAAGVSHLPLSGSNSTEGYLVEGSPPANPNEIPEAAVRTVTPGYFRTLSIPVLAGRDFETADRPGSPPVIVVNRAFADRYWGVEHAVGGRIFFADSRRRSAAQEVIGVVGNVHHSSLDVPPVPEIYVCYEQRPYDAMVLVVRSKGTAALAAEIRDEVARLDPELPVFDVRTMTTVLAESTSPPRFYTALIGTFAGLALLIAAAGIYSVLAYSAALRRREMGIRLALGAPRRHVAALVIGEAMALAGAGIAAGVLAAVFATRALGSLLFGIRPFDPLIFAAAALLLSLVALAASLVPASRCARVSPLAAMRSPTA